MPSALLRRMLGFVVTRHFHFFLTFIEPQGATHGELNQPSPQFQADRPQSVSRFMVISRGMHVVTRILLKTVTLLNRPVGAYETANLTVYDSRISRTLAYEVAAAAAPRQGIPS